LENWLNGKCVYFSSKEKISDGIILDDGIIKECKDNLRRHILNTKNMNLRGTHNSENACAAIAATRELVDLNEQVEVLTNFKGVEHRLEFLRELEEVKWYNDAIRNKSSKNNSRLKII
jgi:UDP-N-acetylmuramoylalanine--D-glutamate ligase